MSSTTQSSVCNFFCGSPDPNNIFVTACNQICETRENCALTANILFTFFDGIFTQRDIFVAGTGTLIQDRVTGLALRLAIYQQLPWFIGFIVIMIILVGALIISPLTAVLFVIVAGLLIAFFLFLTYSDTQITVANTANDVRDQLIADFAAGRNAVIENTSGPLFHAITASQVPCGCQCPMNGGMD